MADTTTELRRKITLIEQASDCEVGVTSSLQSSNSASPMDPQPQTKNCALVDEDDLYKRVRWKAMDLLCRREHSRKELKAKLKLRFEDADNKIESALSELLERGLQDDQRFCLAYVAMRRKKGLGPQRICQELDEKGVAESLIFAALEAEENDWPQQAYLVWQKKFKGQAPADLKDLAKQQSFLQYRGFTREHTRDFMS